MVFYGFYDVLCTCNEVAISHFAVLSASSRSSGFHAKSPYCMQIFIFMRALVCFLMIFSPVFIFYFRASSGRVATGRGSNFQGLKGHLKVLCDGSTTGIQGTSFKGGHGTAFKSTLMESCMDIASCIIMLVMWSGKRTTYMVSGSGVGRGLLRG